MAKSVARIGLSGWNYPAWRRGFYAGVPQRRWLQYCAERFTGIEVNATFYGQQRETTFRKWRDETPADFAFAIKGHRFVTHVRRLNNVEDSVQRQRDSVSPLGDKLSVMLWQLPETLHKNMERLRGFATLLDDWSDVRHTIEFRHTSWFDGEVAECLTEHRLAACLSDAADWSMWDPEEHGLTTDLVYIRLHGHTRTYASSYSEESLKEWAALARRWLDERREVHIYFDNDAEGAAPYNALRLMDLLGLTKTEAAGAQA